MNHEDTKEGLRHCSVYHDIDSCSGCPYRSGDFARNGCENDLMFNALLLIEELEASLRAMQRTVHELTASRFFCINYGQEGLPIWRKRRRESGHLKGLYCIRCRMVINHYEARTQADVDRFRAAFEAGEFREAAEESIEYAKMEGL